MFVVPKARPKKAVKGWQLVGRGKPSASPAKAPASVGNASKGELEALAARNGWAPRALTYDDVQQMSSAELRFHEVWNSEALNEAFKNEEARRHRKEIIPLTRIRLAWQGNFTEEEDRLAREAGHAWASRTPQFERTLENAKKVANHMQERLYDATKPESYARAFRELVEAGKITPLKPESADEYLQKHPELRDTRTPPMIQARETKAAATADFAAKTQAATAKAGSTTIVDYENEHSGYPAAPTKYSFRKLLDSLSADEFQKRLNEDRPFAAAVDKLNNGNR